MAYSPNMTTELPPGLRLPSDFRKVLSLKAACLALGVILCAPSAAHPHSLKRKTLEIVHPWVRAMSDGTVSAIGYVTIKNTGKITDRLIGASLSGATAAEIVGPPTEDGATFRPITEVQSPPAQPSRCSRAPQLLSSMDRSNFR